MKKIFTLFAAVMMAAGAMAQTWYVGGNFGMGTTGIAKDKWNSNGFNFELSPTAGYEFNDKWAIEFGGNINAAVDSEKDGKYSDKNSLVGGGFFVYGRYTAWNNGILYIDLKFGDEYTLAKNVTYKDASLVSQDMLVFMPQLRVRVHEHVDLGLNMGKFGMGLQSVEKTTMFAYKLGINAGVNCVYRF